MAGEGQLKKLTLSPCTVLENGDLSVGSARFEVMLNPPSYSRQYGINYDQKAAIGKLSPVARFSGIEGETIDVDLILDGTGVAGSTDVKTQLNNLGAIVYDYDGDNHEPNVVRLLWGSLVFFGRLKSMSVDYTLFKPSGEPLRAKAKLSFVAYMSPEEESRRANRSSPDLSHSVEVKAGDTLPLLCYRIYKDSSYYPDVARYNNLSDFRNLEPGTRISFPPLTPPREPEAPMQGVRKYPSRRWAAPSSTR